MGILTDNKIPFLHVTVLLWYFDLSCSCRCSHCSEINPWHLSPAALTHPSFSQHSGAEARKEKNPNKKEKNKGTKGRKVPGINTDFIQENKTKQSNLLLLLSPFLLSSAFVVVVVVATKINHRHGAVSISTLRRPPRLNFLAALFFLFVFFFFFSFCLSTKRRRRKKGIKRKHNKKKDVKSQRREKIKHWFYFFQFLKKKDKQGKGKEQFF